MPGYTPTALHKLQHKPLDFPQYTPHLRNKTAYGKLIQLATQQSSASKLNSTEKIVCNPSTAISYNMLMQYTQPCAQPSTKYLHVNMNRPKTQ